MTLLDPNRKCYFVVKTKLKKGIFDENGKLIGRIRHSILKHNFKIEEIDHTPLFSIQRKIRITDPVFEIKDSAEKTLGKVKIKTKFTTKPNLSLKDKEGNVVLYNHGGNVDGWGDIDDHFGKHVGRMSDADLWFSKPKASELDKNWTIGLSIVDQSFDRKVLLGFFISWVESIPVHVE